MTIASHNADDFDKLLAKEFETFKTNFDSILATLTANNQKVFVMTVYHPYIH